MTSVIRIVLADDQALVRSGFRLIIENETDLTVVADAENGREVTELCLLHNPDVVLMDIQMPELNGLQAAEQILVQQPTVKVIILTTFERDDYIFEALQLGASGFLLKNAPPEDLLDAIRTVAAGEALLAPSVTRRVISTFVGKSVVGPRVQDLDLLTEREHDVLLLIAQGKSNAEIASELFVGEATVKTHVSSMLNKLCLRDRVQAVVFAFENGVAKPL